MSTTVDVVADGESLPPSSPTPSVNAHRWGTLCRRMNLGLCAAFSVVALVAMFSGNAVIGGSVSTSVADVLLVMVVHIIFIAALHGGLNLRVLSHGAVYEGVLVLLLLTAKLWVFQMRASVFGSIVLLSALLTVCGNVTGCIALNHAQTATSVRLRWRSAMIILRPYFVPDGLRNKLFVALTWIVLILGKACSVAAPLVIGRVVSNLSRASDGPIDPSVWLIVVYCLLNWAPGVLSEVQDSLYVHVFQTAYAQVAEITIRHVHGLSVEWHLQKKMGNVVRSLDRGMEGADSLMYNALLFFVPACVSAVASLVVVSVHFSRPEISAICYLGFGFYCWFTLVGTVWRNAFRREMNVDDNEMHDIASDALVNFETVKCFTAEEHEVQRYLNSVRRFQKANFQTQTSTSAMNVSQLSAIQLSMLGSLAVGAYAVAASRNGAAQSFSVGDFVAVQAYVLSIFSPLSYLGIVYSSMMNAATDLESLSELLAAKADVVDNPMAVELVRNRGGEHEGADVEFRDVCFHYPTSVTVGLQHVSFTIPAGTTTAIVGTTGSGKTTISRLLFRYYDVVSGAVLVNGQDIRNVTQLSLRAAIGVVPQDTVLFNETVMYNIRYGKLDATDDEVISAAKAAKVHESIMRFEHGYDSVCGERGLKLSGGEKQRVAIARCLLKNPPIVVLDEATSALDNRTEREIQHAMSCLTGRTTLIIAHRLTTVMNADQILVLHNGAVVERGKHAELLAKKGRYYEMWEAQWSLVQTDEAAERSTDPQEQE